MLTRLRQLCISPALLDKDYTEESVKIKRLLEIVKELIKDNHKILIFSSFKSAVELVRNEFAKENITIFEMKKADTTLEDAFMKLIEGGN